MLSFQSIFALIFSVNYLKLYKNVIWYFALSRISSLGVVCLLMSWKLLTPTVHPFTLCYWAYVRSSYCIHSISSSSLRCLLLPIQILHLDTENGRYVQYSLALSLHLTCYLVNSLALVTEALESRGTHLPQNQTMELTLALKS